MTWNDNDDEPREWEIEPEEEKADKHPVLGGTTSLARVVFLAVLLVIVIGGALALVRGVGSWLEQ